MFTSIKQELLVTKACKKFLVLCCLLVDYHKWKLIGNIPDFKLYLIFNTPSLDFR